MSLDYEDGMGLPAFSIPASMVDELPAILEATGAVVEQRPVDVNRINANLGVTLPSFYYLCTSAEGAVVTVKFSHAAIVPRDELIVILQPVSPSRLNIRLRKEGQMLRNIMLALKRHGAVEFPPP